MAPNMLLLAFSPDVTGLTTEANRSSRLHRLYDFIVEEVIPGTGIEPRTPRNRTVRSWVL